MKQVRFMGIAPQMTAGIYHIYRNLSWGEPCLFFQSLASSPSEPVPCAVFVFLLHIDEQNMP